MILDHSRMRKEVSDVEQVHSLRLKPSLPRKKRTDLLYLHLVVATLTLVFQLVPAAGQIFGNVPPGGRQRGGILGGHLRQGVDDDQVRPGIFAQAGGGRLPGEQLFELIARTSR